MINSIREILFRLVSVQSDTGTLREIQMADCILDIIKEQKYFIENPDLCGKYYNNDFLNRPVVWALHRGKSKRTIVLTGHYDAVEIDSYGAIKEYALNPDELREKLKSMNIGSDAKKDIQNPDWYFGRGINDMKAGIAINLDAVASSINEDVNVLFVAVHDEENLSAGMRQSAKLFCELKEKFDLDYKLILITEPHIRDQEDKFKVFVGTVGKIMPSIVVKGRIAHGSDVMEGLNSTVIMSEIITNLELNPDLCSTDMGMTTPPPTVLYARDLKEIYDVSVPEYSAIYLNYQFLKSKTPIQILEDVKSICNESFDTIIDKYNRVFDILNKKASLNGKIKREYGCLVYTFEEIDKIAEENNDNYSELKKELYEKIYELVSNNKMTIQDAGVYIIKSIIELSMITEPLVVIGFIPPYYPSANNSYLENNNDKYVECIENTLVKDFGLKIEKENYFMGICDGSYTSCTDRESEEEVMSNMVTPNAIYNIPFDDIEKISAPFIVVGPWGKDYHTITERVYMPDVETTVPGIIRELINNI
ncbi:arginine utilization protein RocB [Sedimentibacter acidaminivorans]|uniref:Arginine utilization protein RocB n=1 Tax=Sedimentibacter acidaminivorans TaxID=913099 RepID=A0ABS4GAD2_9FIRM|nr:M20/M25/M40 family metallo-hydrolase [Sedimentibacter acidaminivorans]MBP1924492.1 arginine utilization protein RocB [Sedimentibacter acidaminivorans]